MTKKELLEEFIDTVRLVPNYSLKGLKDQFMDSARKGKKSLQVSFNATHAGVLTGKGAFYLPTEMERGGLTLLKNFPKPVLKEHNDTGDPLGRVTGVKYIDTSDSYISKYPFLTTLLHPNTTKGKKIELARKVLSDIIGQDHEDYQGLGYLHVTTEITDQDAIEKFLDGRYMTPSTRFRPTKAIHCGLCGQNLMDGQNTCEHEPGDSEGGIPFFVIPFGFDYKEISVVSVPADRFANIDKLVMQDSLVDLNPVIVDEPSNKRHVFHFYADSLVELKLESGDEEMPLPEEEKKEEVILEEEKPVETPPEEKKEEVAEESKEEIKEEEKKEEEVPAEEKKEEVKEEEKPEELKEEKKIEDSLSDKDWIAEQFKDAESTVFAGPYHSFPMENKEQLEKGFTLLEGYADSEMKQMILSALSRRKEFLEAKPEEKAKDFQDSDEEVLKNINEMIETLAASYPGDDEDYSGPEEKEFFEEEEVSTDKEDPKKKPGGSNAGKYKKGPFCGPSGGAPKGTYPVNTRKRAKAALSLARHAPNPAGIKSCVRRHWPGLGKDSEIQEVHECKDCEGKQLKIATLQAQLDSEKAMNQLFVDSLRSGKVLPVIEKKEEEVPVSEFKDKDILESPVLEDPTLTKGKYIADNVTKDKNPKEEYKDIYDHYRGLINLGRDREAQSYLSKQKYLGFLPAEVEFN